MSLTTDSEDSEGVCMPGWWVAHSAVCKHVCLNCRKTWVIPLCWHKWSHYTTHTEHNTHWTHWTHWTHRTQHTLNTLNTTHTEHTEHTEHNTHWTHWTHTEHVTAERPVLSSTRAQHTPNETQYTVEGLSSLHPVNKPSSCRPTMHQLTMCMWPQTSAGDSPKRDSPSLAPLPSLYEEGWDSFWNICSALEGVAEGVPVNRHRTRCRCAVRCEQYT